MKVLIADDSESIRELVGMTLESAGYEVKKAADGVEALNMLRAEKANQIITDLNLPNMDGITLVKKIRLDPSKAGIPILLLTTESQVDKKEEAKKAGATGWIVKPFAQEKLLNIVKRVVR